MMVAGSGGRRKDHDWRVLQFSSLSQGSQPQIHHPHIGCHHTENPLTPSQTIGYYVSECDT